MRSNSKPRIWIDLENTPHVPFFEPIIDELRARGYPVTVTARDAFQVCDLADAKGMPYVKIGRHYGKNRFLKVAGLCWRSLQLAPVALRERPALALNHGSRAQILLCNLLRIPSMLIMDYEHSQGIPFMGPTWELVPDVVGGKDTWHTSSQDQLLKYPGIKEDVYAWKLVPDPGILSSLGLETSDLIVTVRPPATEAHYHNPESEKLFTRFMERACLTPGTRVVLLPRNKKQADVIRRHYPEWFANARTVIPREAVDGMNLIWHSDLVVSGGGTMNREAAALGVPVYSIFRGPIGAVDRELARQGRLILVEDEEQVESEILLKKRQARPLNEMTSRKVLLYIVDTIETILRKQSLTKSA